MTKNFEELNLSPNILSALSELEYSNPTQIQEQAIPQILSGKDLFACAQTGTGKTAAFVLPILDLLQKESASLKTKEFKALILVPTRELAEQVSQNIEKYSKNLSLKCKKVYGGVSISPQIRILEGGLDILVATPGRLIDLHKQKKLNYNGLKYLVLDEADRMLDMGFLPDIKRIVGYLPSERQSLLFSATLSDEIKDLASFIVKDPLSINVSPKTLVVDKIQQNICFIDKANKYSLLQILLDNQLNRNSDSLALVFCKTKRQANNISRKLNKDGYQTNAIHGDKTQAGRQKAIDEFKSRTSRVLIATDIAARGIDVKDMSLVINYDMPMEPESYVHRIGRTARANLDGEALSFCSLEELHLLRTLEKFLKKEIQVSFDNPFHKEEVFKLYQDKKIKFKAPKASNNSRGSRKPDFSKDRRSNSKKSDFSKDRKPHNKSNSKRSDNNNKKTDFKKFKFKKPFGR